MRRITLRVFSALDGVGLTAAVANALATRGIACNVVTAYRHDHIFVPSDRAQEAIEALHELQCALPRYRATNSDNLAHPAMFIGDLAALNADQLCLQAVGDRPAFAIADDKIAL